MTRTAIAIGFLSLVGCFGSRGADAQADVQFGRDASWERYDAPPVDTAGVLATDGITVAPDRAVVRADLSVRADSYAATTERSHDAARRVIEALSQTERCSAVLVDQHSPRGESDNWSATFSVRMDADVTGLSDLAARAQVVDRCIGQFHALAEDSALVGASIAVGDAAWLVDDVSRHRATLLEQRFAVLRELESAADRPASFRVEAITCTSKGTVAPTRASIAGVALAVDFTCTP